MNLQLEIDELVIKAVNYLTKDNNVNLTIEQFEDISSTVLEDIEVEVFKAINENIEKQITRSVIYSLRKLALHETQLSNKIIAYYQNRSKVPNQQEVALLATFYKEQV